MHAPAAAALAPTVAPAVEGDPAALAGPPQADRFKGDQLTAASLAASMGQTVYVAPAQGPQARVSWTYFPATMPVEACHLPGTYFHPDGTFTERDADATLRRYGADGAITARVDAGVTTHYGEWRPLGRPAQPQPGLVPSMPSAHAAENPITYMGATRIESPSQAVPARADAFAPEGQPPGTQRGPRLPARLRSALQFAAAAPAAVPPSGASQPAGGVMLDHLRPAAASQPGPPTQDRLAGAPAVPRSDFPPRAAHARADVPPEAERPPASWIPGPSGEPPGSAASRPAAAPTGVHATSAAAGPQGHEGHRPRRPASSRSSSSSASSLPSIDAGGPAPSARSNAVHAAQAEVLAALRPAEPLRHWPRRLAGPIASAVGMPVSDSQLARMSDAELARMIPGLQPPPGAAGRRADLGALIAARNAASDVMAVAMMIEPELGRVGEPGKIGAFGRYWHCKSHEDEVRARCGLAEDMAYALHRCRGQMTRADLLLFAETTMARGRTTDQETTAVQSAIHAASTFGVAGATAGALSTFGLLAGPAAPMVSALTIAGSAATTALPIAFLHATIPEAWKEGVDRAVKDGRAVPATTVRVPRGGTGQEVAANLAGYQVAFQPPGLALSQAAPIGVKTAVAVNALPAAASQITGAVMGPAALVLSPLGSAIGGIGFTAFKELTGDRVWTRGVSLDAQGRLKLDADTYCRTVDALARSTSAGVVGQRVKAGARELWIDRLPGHLDEASKNPVVRRQAYKNSTNLFGAAAVAGITGAALANAAPPANAFAPNEAGVAVTTGNLVGWGVTRAIPGMAPLPAVAPPAPPPAAAPLPPVRTGRGVPGQPRGDGSAPRMQPLAMAP